MLNPKLQEALNKQINAELYSAYLYPSMAAHFESKNLKGMAHWMRIQEQEELTHAMRFYSFVLERGGRVMLTQIAAPKTEWKSRSRPSRTRTSTSEGHRPDQRAGRIWPSPRRTTPPTPSSNGSSTSRSRKRPRRWIVDKLKLVGDNGVALFMIDNELATRTLSPTAMPAGGV